MYVNSMIYVGTYLFLAVPTMWGLLIYNLLDVEEDIATFILLQYGSKIFSSTLIKIMIHFLLFNSPVYFYSYKFRLPQLFERINLPGNKWVLYLFVVEFHNFSEKSFWFSFQKLFECLFFIVYLIRLYANFNLLLHSYFLVTFQNCICKQLY